MPVAQSSHVNSYEYDPATGTITIQFVNGAVYTGHMGQAEYDIFHQSGSKGSYVQNSLRGRLQMVIPAMKQTRRRLR